MKRSYIAFVYALLLVAILVLMVSGCSARQPPFCHTDLECVRAFPHLFEETPLSPLQVDSILNSHKEVRLVR